MTDITFANDAEGDFWTAVYASVAHGMDTAAIKRVAAVADDAVVALRKRYPNKQATGEGSLL